MRTETWTCDWCGAELPGLPALQPCIREPATGNTLLDSDCCQGCFEKFVTMLDPTRSQRNAIGAKLGRPVCFQVFPNPLTCNCKSAVTCPHRGGG